jgi:uncharacterized protein YecT (DUF1311 family)
MKRFVFVLLLGLASAGVRAQSPGFDCAAAFSTAEHLVCANPDLAVADTELNLLYSALMKKPRRPAALPVEQRRWLREIRNACTDTDCLRTVYRQRIADLSARNAEVLQLAGARFEPLFQRGIAQINDTWVVRGLRLRADTPRRFQLELHVDPGDHLAWRLPGPRVQVFCRDPDWREGYASRFQHLAQAHGVDFVPVRRDQGQGYILMALDMGKTLPLGEDVVCSVAFTEWLLEKPSTLYVLDGLPP